MSHESPANPHGDEALAAARSALSRLMQIEHALPQPGDIQALQDAIVRARRSLQADSIASALRDESTYHITARMDLVIAFCRELEVATQHLAELADKLSDDSRAIVNAIESPSDGDL